MSLLRSLRIFFARLYRHAAPPELSRRTGNCFGQLLYGVAEDVSQHLDAVDEFLFGGLRTIDPKTTRCRLGREEDVARGENDALLARFIARLLQTDLVQ